MITGSLRSGERLAKAGLAPPSCTHCGHNCEDIHHVMWVCPKWEAVRQNYTSAMNAIIDKQEEQAPGTREHMRERMADPCFHTCGIMRGDPYLQSRHSAPPSHCSNFCKRHSVGQHIEQNGADPLRYDHVGRLYVFTDGTADYPTDPIRRRAAWAVVFADGHPWNIGGLVTTDDQTVFRAELMAIAHALATSHVLVAIVSDCKSVVHLVRARMRGGRAPVSDNVDLWAIIDAELDAQTEGYHDVRWIKAHIPLAMAQNIEDAGGFPAHHVHMNDLADKEAKKAAEAHTYDRTLFRTATTRAAVTALTQAMMVQIWNEWAAASNYFARGDDEEHAATIGMPPEDHDGHGDEDDGADEGEEVVDDPLAHLLPPEEDLQWHVEEEDEDPFAGCGFDDDGSREPRGCPQHRELRPRTKTLEAGSEDGDADAQVEVTTPADAAVKQVEGATLSASLSAGDLVSPEAVGPTLGASWLSHEMFTNPIRDGEEKTNHQLLASLRGRYPDYDLDGHPSDETRTSSIQLTGNLTPLTLVPHTTFAHPTRGRIRTTVDYLPHFAAPVNQWLQMLNFQKDDEKKKPEPKCEEEKTWLEAVIDFELTTGIRLASLTGDLTTWTQRARTLASIVRSLFRTNDYTRGGSVCRIHELFKPLPAARSLQAIGGGVHQGFVAVVTWCDRRTRGLTAVNVTRASWAAKQDRDNRKNIAEGWVPDFAGFPARFLARNLNDQRAIKLAHQSLAETIEVAHERRKAHQEVTRGSHNKVEAPACDGSNDTKTKLGVNNAGARRGTMSNKPACRIGQRALAVARASIAADMDSGRLDSAGKVAAYRCVEARLENLLHDSGQGGRGELRYTVQRAMPMLLDPATGVCLATLTTASAKAVSDAGAGHSGSKVEVVRYNWDNKTASIAIAASEEIRESNDEYVGVESASKHSCSSSGGPGRARKRHRADDGIRERAWWMKSSATVVDDDTRHEADDIPPPRQRRNGDKRKLSACENMSTIALTNVDGDKQSHAERSKRVKTRVAAIRTLTSRGTGACPDHEQVAADFGAADPAASGGLQRKKKSQREEQPDAILDAEIDFQGVDAEHLCGHVTGGQYRINVNLRQKPCVAMVVCPVGVQVATLTLEASANLVKLKSTCKRARLEVMAIQQNTIRVGIFTSCASLADVDDAVQIFPNQERSLKTARLDSG